MQLLERTSRVAGRGFATPFVIGGLAVVVFGIWIAKDAGYRPTTWYPGGLFLLCLAFLSFVAYGRLALPRYALVAIGCLTGFAVWCAISVSWSEDKGIAWDGANRTLLYALVYGLFASVPWRRESIPVFMCGLSLAALAIGLVDLARAAAGDPERFFVFGRFSAPAGYPNAACAVYFFGFWPLAYLAARREVAPLARGVLLAAATALAELVLLTQSRGSLYAGPVGVVAFVLFVPQRLRAALALAAVGIAVLAAHGPLLDVFDAVRSDTGAEAALRDALTAIGVSAGAVLVVWTIVAMLDRRSSVEPRIVRIANRAAVVVVIAALIAGAAILGAADPGPRERLTHAWRTFKAGYPDQTSSSRFSLGLGSNRYDFWRVSLLEFRDHPLEGVGVDNFAHDYVRERRSSEEPLYPHSLIFRVPAQTGIVGTILFAGFVAAAAVAAAVGVWRRGDLPAGVARAGLAAVAYFAAHASFDWFWEFPALTAPALAWLGLAAGLHRDDAPRKHPRVGRLGVAIASAIAVAFAASLLFPWLAELEARRAADIWPREPARAFADLDRSRDLNPLSTGADLLAGAVASRINDLPRMEVAFRRAIDRDSHNWYSHFELALALAARDKRHEALRELETAQRLNPREGLIRIIHRAVAAGRPVNRHRIDRLFVERVRARVGP